MGIFANPLTDLLEYEDFSRDFLKGTDPVGMTGCIDSEKVHFMSTFLGEKKVQLVVTYNEQRAREIEEDYKLGKIIKATHKRKSDTIKKLVKEKFTNKPISKVTRDEVVKYLENLKNYSKSTIKQNYELLCMAFGQAKYENIITD